jgi:hypothetical protein
MRLGSTVLVALFLAALGTAALAQSFDSDALSFAKIPPGLGTPVSAKVPACPLLEPTDIPDGISPEHFAVAFKGPKPLPVDTFRECNLPNFNRPEVRVFSVDAFNAVDKESVAVFAKLQAVLKAGKLDPNADIPFQLFVDAHPAFVEHVAFQRFQNGQGFGFLTQWMIESDTIGEQLVYLFQGITDDGKSYLVAYVPIRSLRPLDSFPEFRNETYEQSEARYAPYSAKITAIVHAAGDSEFQPDLAAVREWLATILVK